MRRAWITIAAATAAFAASLAALKLANPWALATLAALVSSALAIWTLGDRLRSLLAWRPGGAAAALVLGALAVIATHAAYAVLVRLMPGAATETARLYAELAAPPGPTWAIPLVALVVWSEEIVWRGVAFELTGREEPGAREAALATALYVLPQLAAGTWLLPLAALCLGALLAALRLRTGRITEPLLVHVVWSVGVFSLFPLA